ncbi:recombinase family protein [Rhodococcus sp. T2V]|nr:recombinase family protein [Rhodococcus sp. T2V]MDF3312880.1 recombinase family protein [Rhodococcus sp. T2V]
MKASRPELDLALQRLRADDVLVITRLDRLGRSMLHLITLGADLRERCIGLKVLEQGIDRRGPRDVRNVVGLPTTLCGRAAHQAAPGGRTSSLDCGSAVPQPSWPP